jgi:phage FluMu protein Com
MEEIRCGSCSRKLAMGEYAELQIKCPRCGTLNHLKAASLSPERRGASNDKESTHDRKQET